MMPCERLGCSARQSELHQQIGTPPVYYCCRCNGCRPGCRARGSNSHRNAERYGYCVAQDSRS